MRFTYGSWLLCSGLFLFLIACDSSTPNQDTTPPPPKDEIPVSLRSFVQQMKQAEAGQDIPSSLSAAYIAPALAKDSLYPYLSDEHASYQYGEMIYEDSSLMVLSFYYKALDGRSLLAASFLASYDRATETCLDMRPIFSSSTFDWSATEGYQLGLSCQSSINYIDNGSLGILQLESSVKHFYTALEKGVVPRPNTTTISQHVLQPNGKFSSRVLSSQKRTS
ncbi:MAG: hypothetical protein AB8E82_04240 [Aureispira sp.]